MQIQEVFDRRRFVFLDGGMGTQLQQRGLQPGQKPELAALEMPDVLTAIHRDYTAAGADILLANTFGANAKKLAGCGHSVEEVVSASIACARRAGQETSALVALDIGVLQVADIAVDQGDGRPAARLHGAVEAERVDVQVTGQEFASTGERREGGIAVRIVARNGALQKRLRRSAVGSLGHDGVRGGFSGRRGEGRQNENGSGDQGVCRFHDGELTR